MREDRSPSNILFGFLPGQTADLQRGVWRVVQWRSPGHEPCRDPALRQEIVRQATPWSTRSADSGFVADLLGNAPVELVELSSAGVQVERFPRTWRCKRCSRIESGSTSTCKCGVRDWGQLHYVAYHDCGVMEEPQFPRCPQHHQVCIRTPASAAMSEIRFECPVCNRLLQRGPSFRRCSCGHGNLTHNVHRAASVFTPRTAVVVNAVDPKLRDLIQQAGGPKRAVTWVLGGMTGKDFTSLPPTRASMLQTLLEQGVARNMAEATVAQMVSSGAIRDTTSGDSWHALAPEAVEQQAISIATALYSGRVRLQDLERGGQGDSERVLRYRSAMARAGVVDIDLVDRFPVLTAVYGFTRGDMEVGNSTLVPFHFPRGNAYAIYVDRAETEALFFRLDPLRVHRWLISRGFDLPAARDAQAAQRSIIANARWPQPGEPRSPSPGLGETVLTLVHSYAHRVMRKLPVLAGVDRDSLSEFLVPAHLGFFVYAASKGSFVLGGLQALFENELDVLLEQVCFSEHRCAMDPGCVRSGGACACCLHVGEPSCRWYNRFLDRRSLHGQGYTDFADARS